MSKIIEVDNLHKSYGDIHAVKGISFYVEQGKLFSFLGPNGAGKSTTIDILCTLLSKDSGDVFIDGRQLGRDDQEIRKKIGVVFQDNVLDGLLTVRENLAIRAQLYTKKRTIVQEAIRQVSNITEIGEFIDRRYAKLSGGQRRRVDIARALVQAPKILFLDEPTTGLDPQTRQHVWEMIRELQRQTGTTIFLTTHYMEEAAASDYIVLIDHGTIAAKGTPSELKTEYAKDVLHFSCRDKRKVRAILGDLKLSYHEQGEDFRVQLQATTDALPILKQVGAEIINFEVLNGTMDDAFINITGREMRE